MKYLRQFCIILIISFVGDLLHSVLPLPVPGSIYGILLLFALLKSGLLPLEAVKDTGKFLIEIMPVMFIPAAVGLVESWGVIGKSLGVYALVTVVSTILVMAVSGIITQKFVGTDVASEKEAKTKKTKEKTGAESVTA